MEKTLNLKSFALIIIYFSWADAALGQVSLTKIDQPITLDGIIDETAWETVDALPNVQYEPIFMGDMSEESVFKVAYDENYIYVAGEIGRAHV